MLFPLFPCAVHADNVCPEIPQIPCLQKCFKNDKHHFSEEIPALQRLNNASNASTFKLASRIDLTKRAHIQLVLIPNNNKSPAKTPITFFSFHPIDLPSTYKTFCTVIRTVIAPGKEETGLH